MGFDAHAATLHSVFVTPPHVTITLVPASHVLHVVHTAGVESHALLLYCPVGQSVHDWHTVSAAAVHWLASYFRAGHVVHVAQAVLQLALGLY